MSEPPGCTFDIADRFLHSSIVMAGRSQAEILSAIKAAFENRQFPDLESGAMCSKSDYLTDEGDHNAPHLMFFTAVMGAKDWGCGVAGSPVVSAPIGSSRRRNHPE